MKVPIKCVCPGVSRHPAGDVLTFVDKPDFRRAVSMQKSITMLKSEDPDAAPEEILAVLSEAYILYGIESWTLLDRAGKKLPVTSAHIRDRILADLEISLNLADTVDDLYSEIILLPLVRRASTSSPDSPTIDTTSATTSSSPTSRKRSSRSSTTTTRTDGIATTSPQLAGGSRSSPSQA